MYISHYYTCEQIDQRLLQGYLDDYNDVNHTSLTKEQFLLRLNQVFSGEGGGSGEITDGSITEDKIANGSITEDKIANGTVSEDKIANGAVSEDKIANGAVSEDKMKYPFIQLLPISHWFYHSDVSIGDPTDPRSCYGLNQHHEITGTVEEVHDDVKEGSIAAYYEKTSEPPGIIDEMLYFNGSRWVHLENYRNYLYFYGGVLYSYEQDGPNIILKGHFLIKGWGGNVITFHQNQNREVPHLRIKYGQARDISYDAIEAWYETDSTKKGPRLVVANQAATYENRADKVTIDTNVLVIKKNGHNLLRTDNIAAGMQIPMIPESQLVTLSQGEGTTQFNRSPNRGYFAVCRHSSNGNYKVSELYIGDSSTTIRAGYKLQLMNMTEDAINRYLGSDGNPIKGLKDGYIELLGNKKVSIGVNPPGGEKRHIVDFTSAGNIRLRYKHQGNPGLNGPRILLQDENGDDMVIAIDEYGDIDWLYIDGMDNLEKTKNIFLNTPNPIHSCKVIDNEDHGGVDYNIYISNPQDHQFLYAIRSAAGYRRVNIYLTELIGVIEKIAQRRGCKARDKGETYGFTFDFNIYIPYSLGAHSELTCGIDLYVYEIYDHFIYQDTLDSTEEKSGLLVLNIKGIYGGKEHSRYLTWDFKLSFINDTPSRGWDL